MRTREYHAKFRLSDDIWLVEIEEIPEIHSFGATLSQAKAHIRDALCLWLECDDTDALLISDRFDGLPTGLLEVVSEARVARIQAQELSRRAQELTAQAARALVDEQGMSTRDAAALLGLSHQRMHHLVRH